MALSDATRNAMLDLLNTRASHLSLHTADPGTSGTSEATGGSYARQAASWSAANAGSKAAAAAAFPVAAGTYTHIGYWTALSGGTFNGSRALSPSVTFGGASTLTVTPTETLS